MTRTNIEMCV